MDIQDQTVIDPTPDRRSSSTNKLLVQNFYRYVPLSGTTYSLRQALSPTGAIEMIYVILINIHMNIYVRITLYIYIIFTKVS